MVAKTLSKKNLSKRRKLSAKVFLNKLAKERKKAIESEKKEMKFIDKWSGYTYMYGKRKKIKIEIFKSKNKKYYINITPSNPKHGFGPLTKVIRKKPEYEKYVMELKQFKKLDKPIYTISVGISKKGSHHGNRGSFQDYFYFDFNDKNDSEKLFTFLSKYTTVVDKTKKNKTKKKEKRK